MFLWYIIKKIGGAKMYIGIDLGTSAVKLLLMSEEGKILNSVFEEYPVYYPQLGYSEQEPDDWWNAVNKCIVRLIKDYDKSMVKGITVAGQMHGLVTLDNNDKVIRRAILWNDGRSEKETNYLNEHIGKEKLTEYTGNIAFAGFTAPKILWMKNNEPDNFCRIYKIMLPKDYIVYKLTNNFVTDVSDASGTLLCDVKNKCWSKEMLEICSVKEEWLPMIHESSDIVGNISKNVAYALGLPEHVKVCAGAGDNAAGAIGTGTVGEGMCTISLGTSGTIFISEEFYTVDKNNSVHSFAHADGKYHMLGCILSAASCFKWWVNDILRSDKYDEIQKNIDEEKNNGVYFLPYLMGERSPHNDPDARGVFMGMTMSTTREEMTLAVLEGVAFALRDSYEKSGIKEINSLRLCGGGAKSELWRRIIANVFNSDVYIMENEEGPSFGAAILTMKACSGITIEKAIEKTVRVKEIIHPDKNKVGIYDEKYIKFSKIYPCIKNLYKEIQ